MYFSRYSALLSGAHWLLVSQLIGIAGYFTPPASMAVYIANEGCPRGSLEIRLGKKSIRTYVGYATSSYRLFVAVCAASRVCV